MMRVESETGPNHEYKYHFIDDIGIGD